MKPIALAQQIMLLHSWARDNNGRTGKLGSPMVLPAHVKGEFYIPRNPKDNILQSEQTKFQIESFGIGEVFTSGIFFAVRTLYDPNAYEDRTVRIIRLNYHKVKRGETMIMRPYFPTIIFTPLGIAKPFTTLCLRPAHLLPAPLNWVVYFLRSRVRRFCP